MRIGPITHRLLEESVPVNRALLVGNADLILDCMYNFPTRYVLNECAIRKNIPLVHGSIWGLDGRLTFIMSPETPCLRCYFPRVAA